MDSGSVIERLQHWFARQCDGDWEHDRGVSIESCDNPGWWIKVDLKGTTLESSAFHRIAENVDDVGLPRGRHWFDCSVKDGQWHGAGDETALERILETFLQWAENNDA